MTETNFSLMADGELDDLPRTLRREREARERAKREEEARKRKATLTHDYDANHRSAAADRPAHVQEAAAAGVVTGFDVPFLHMMRFFIKAVFAAIPALIILGVLLWFAGAALKSFYPQLVHTQILIQFPNRPDKPDVTASSRPPGKAPPAPVSKTR